MHRSLTVGAVALLALASAPAFAKTPTWVRPFDRPIPEAPADATGTHRHLSDMQLRHTPGSLETYRRQLISVHDDEALRYMQQLWFGDALVSIDYVTIRRGDERIAVSTKVHKEFDEEDQMDYFVVDLPALAVGDVIDYAWLERSVTDADIISGWMHLGASSHDWNRVRLLVPSNADVKTALLGTDEQLARDLVGGYLEYVWEAERRPLPERIADTPTWYFQSPILQYSNIDSWASFGALLAKRYGVARPPSTAIAELASSLSSVDKTPVERALAAAEYVQQTIEYRYALFDEPPRPLDEVVTSGQGTPVERALLLAALTRALGLEASIGLANERYGSKLGTLLPGPEVLANALTGVRLGNEHIVWIDPTGRDYASQGFVTPAVESVLLVDPQSTGILDVPTQMPFAPNVDVVEVYQLDGDTAELTVTTVLTRSAAVNMRQRLEWTSAEEIGAEITKVRELDSSVESTAPVSFDDDAAQNRMTVVERYRVNDFWQAGQRAVAPLSIFRAFTQVELGRPRAPLETRHPEHIRHTVLLENLPARFNLPSQKTTFETDAFALDFSQSSTGRTVTAAWVYRSRASYVAADRLDEYDDALSKLPTAFYLRWLGGDDSPATPYWHKFLLILAGFVLLGGGLQTMERRRALRSATARVARSK